MRPAILIASSTLVLMAQEALPVTSWDWVIQGGALAILGFAVIWGMTRTIPSMFKNQELERQQFWERMDRWEKGSREDSTRLNTTLDAMTSHCRDTIQKVERGR